MIEHSKLRDGIDWGLLAIVAAILVIGLFCLYSSTRVTDSFIFYKQLIWIGVGAVAMFIFFLLDYRLLSLLAWPFYVLVVILLSMVLVFGREISGASRWLSLGPVHFQPSELAKVMIIIWVAWWGDHKKHIQTYGLRELIRPLAAISLPFLLILSQPDLGTSGIVLIIATGMLLLLGIKHSTLIGAFMLMVCAAPFGWLSLKEYQKLRILSFLDPSRDPLGSGYHAMQSKIAVGSGRFFGKGFLQGTQTQLKFLPEHHTDFIFSVIAEEWGFVGSILLIGLYLLFITKIISVGIKAKDRFGSMICFGIAIYFTLHVFINIAMVIGIFPVVGVPLPFVSYGGSFMLVNMICLGIVLSVSWRKFMF